ncbi:MAG: hypothetical protein K8T25_12380 [Planctomycetia bacterium]|nr:hypothetical protein [Planctomycetia bacterium]
MKASGIAFVAAIALLGVNQCAKAEAPREFLFSFRVLEKTSPDSQEETVVKQGLPLIIVEESPTECMVGSYVDKILYPFGNDFSPMIGCFVNVFIGKVKDGRAPIDFIVEQSTMANQTAGVTQVLRQSTRIISTVTLDKPARFPWKDGTTGHDRCIEITLTNYAKPLSKVTEQEKSRERTAMQDSAHRGQRRRR